MQTCCWCRGVEWSRQLLLGNAELDLERLWHLWGRRTGQSQLDLHSVVDEPLEGSQGSNHDDSGTQSSPQSLESESLSSISNAGSLSLVHVADDGIGWVRHDGAEDSSDVAGSEGDHQLLRLAALRPGLGHHVLVDGLHGPLEAGELHHGVGDLSAPQGNQGLVETVDALILHYLGESSPQGGGEGSDR